MNKVKIVVGANYGDEGKGLATRYFTLQAKENNETCLNVLYNGGPQRGHTVDLPDGRRHVFHHFGCGTLDGADSYFDREFMVNPMFFVKEYEELEEEFGISPTCFINPLCRVTVPFDMWINQYIEKIRGNNKHGSCGFGIWETQQRYLFTNSNNKYCLPYIELINLTDDKLASYLINIYSEYLPIRLKREYGIDIFDVNKKDIAYICDINLIKHWISDLRFMQEKCEERFLSELEYDCIVFEGAQGLELDEDNIAMYPNVTASKTGSTFPIWRAFNCKDTEICYVTRSYFTRHGAGILPTQCNKEDINPDIEDKTNVYNQYQDAIRYGKFDKWAFLNRIDLDYAKAQDNAKYPIKTSILVTHLNYTNGDIYGDTSLKELSEFTNKIYTSDTKYAEDIKEA